MNTRYAAFTVLAIGSVMACCPVSPALGQPKGPLSEGQIAALVDQAPDENQVPDADALILFDGMYVEYTDGLASVRRQRLIKVFTEHAIDELGDPRLAYDRNRQDLVVHASRSYLLDGSTMDTPENGYNEVTPHGLDLFPERLDVREMVVTHVGLERGVSILLDWTVRDTEPADPVFNRLIFLHDEFPALEKEVAAEGDLWGETVNPAHGLFALPPPDRSGGMLLWHANDLPERPRYAGARMGDQVPWIAIAAAPAWEDVIGALGRGLTLAAEDRVRFESVLDEMEKADPSLSDRGALETFAETIRDRTALVHYRPWDSRPLWRSADEILASSSATPVERCVMVIAACRARGLGAAPVFPARWQSLSAQVPVLEVLGDPLVRATGGQGETWYIDPVEGNVSVKPAAEGGMRYFVADNEQVVLYTRPPGACVARLSIHWDFKEGEAGAEGSITGHVLATLNWEEPEELVSQWAGGWTDSVKVGDVRILASGAEAISYAVTLDAPLPDPDDRGRVIVELPMLPCDMHDLLPPGLDPAHSSIDGVLFPPAPAEVELSWRVRLPDGFALLPGENRSLRLDGGSLEVMRSEDAGRAEVKYRFEWDERGIHPAEYADYRNLILDALDRRFTRLVLVEAEPD